MCPTLCHCAVLLSNSRVSFLFFFSSLECGAGMMESWKFCLVTKQLCCYYAKGGGGLWKPYRRERNQKRESTMEGLVSTMHMETNCIQEETVGTKLVHYKRVANMGPRYARNANWKGLCGKEMLMSDKPESVISSHVSSILQWWICSSDERPAVVYVRQVELNRNWTSITGFFNRNALSRPLRSPIWSPR